MLHMGFASHDNVPAQNTGEPGVDSFDASFSAPKGVSLPAAQRSRSYDAQSTTPMIAPTCGRPDCSTNAPPSPIVALTARSPSPRG